MSETVKPVQAMLIEDFPRLQAILPQGAILCGKEPVEVYLAKDYETLATRLAESERRVAELDLMVSSADFNYDLDRADFKQQLAEFEARQGAAAWVAVDQDGAWSDPQTTRAHAQALADDMNSALPPSHEGPACRVMALYTAAANPDAELVALLQRCQEKLDPHRDAVLWGDVVEALRAKP